jgi:hypothetical protein
VSSASRPSCPIAGASAEGYHSPSARQARDAHIRLRGDVEVGDLRLERALTAQVREFASLTFD